MEIATPRLLLREYEAGDLPALLAYVADPRAREFYGPDDARPDRLRALLATFVAWGAESPRQNYQLALALRAAPERVVGSAGLRRAGAPAGEAELGLELAPAHWGRGYATEAARALLAHGFTALGLAAVRGVTVSANARVAALVRRLGFEPVGAPADGPADGPAPGPAWLAARGWRQVTWRLTRDRWAAGAAGVR
jgi:RimJ/RimL family protein N-acetyltransferase